MKKLDYFEDLTYKKPGKKISTFDARISTFKNKFSKKLNEAIERKIGKKVDDFIIVEELKNDTLYRINEKFL